MQPVSESTGRDNIAPAGGLTAYKSPDNAHEKIGNEDITDRDVQYFQAHFRIGTHDAEFFLEQHDKAHEHQCDDGREVDPVEQPCRQVPGFIFIKLFCLHGYCCIW